MLKVESLVQIDDPVGLLRLHELPEGLDRHGASLVRFAASSGNCGWRCESLPARPAASGCSASVRAC